MQPKQPNKNKAKIEAVTLHVYFYVHLFTQLTNSIPSVPPWKVYPAMNQKKVNKKSCAQPGLYHSTKKISPQSVLLVEKKKLVWNGRFLLIFVVQSQVIGPIVFFSHQPEKTRYRRLAKVFGHPHK